MAVTDAALVASPELGLQQVGVVAHEDVAHSRVAQQKRAEGLGEDIPGADRVPDVARHLLFLGARLRHLAEVAIGEVFDLVIVVEHHLAAARDAEVLPQHVAGKDIGGHQILDGIAVFEIARSMAARRSGLVSASARHSAGTGSAAPDGARCRGG
jgi:hypothetical protein